ncbi:MAG: nodulation protein NoeA [Planctomycetaceae bacterium]|nr:MAG: nodulation protein NoeA [Planctomycetaceae bacterium]
MSTVHPHYAPGSYRDRGARVVLSQNRVLRLMSAEALEAWRHISQLAFYQRLTRQGKLIPSWEPTTVPEEVQADWASGVIEHERVPLVSYPYEWCYGMLSAAANLHLEILREGLPAGVLLKDATPYNVQFRGVAPVFIDIGSFVASRSDLPWQGYRQFCELFLFPLMIQAYRGIDFQPVLRGRLEGISVEQATRWFARSDWWRPGVWRHVVLHGWLQRQLARQHISRRTLQQSGFHSALLARMFAHLQRLVERMTWSPPATVWSEYAAFPHVTADQPHKLQFVEQVCRSRRWRWVWDLGANVGSFAQLAARYADWVLALERDPACVERMYRRFQQQGVHNVLPLLCDLVDASPGMGWRGTERLRLEDRGRPELTLCLGLIHHLVIGANVPLNEVLGWLADLGGELILEWPAKSDPMVRLLLQNKHDQYRDYTWEYLLAGLQERGEVLRWEQLPSGHRHLLHVRFRPATKVAASNNSV